MAPEGLRKTGNSMKMIRYILMVVLTAPLAVSAQQDRQIKGKITDGSAALENVSIRVDGDDNQVFTNADGRYEVRAATGQTLVFTYTGMKTVRVRVEDVTRFVNLTLVPDYSELDEVVVTRRLKSQVELSQEYAQNPDIIRTAYGFVDAKSTSGTVRTVEGKSVNAVFTCILDYLRNRFPGVWVTGQCPTGGQVFIRKVGTLGAPVPTIYDIDGQVFTETPMWLDMNQIDRMAIVSSYSMSTRYGAQGAGGVIIINTSNSKQLALGLINSVDRAAPEALSREEIGKNAPSYLMALRNTADGESAKRVYQDHVTQFAASPYFFLDAYTYFYEERSGIRRCHYRGKQ